MLYFFAIDMMIYLALTYSLSRSLGAIFLYSAISGLWSFGQQPSHHHRKLKLSAKFTFLNSIFTAMTIIASFIIDEPHTLTMCQALLISKRTLFLNSVRNESINSVNYRERVKKNKRIDFSHFMDQQIKVDLLLSDYEEVAAQAVDNGIDLTTQVFFFYVFAAFW